MPTLLVCSATDNLQVLADGMADEARQCMPDLKVILWPEPFDPVDVLAVAAWHPPVGLLGGLPNLRLVASIGAGVEHILRCPDLPAEVPVTRIVDDEQASGMAQYMLWAALHYHRGFDQMAAHQRQGLWRMPPQAPACEFTVGIMGLGRMGLQVATCLHEAGFSVSGWSRRTHTVAGITTYSGDAALPDFLGQLDLVICLLPLTPQTRGLCNADFFVRMKPGAAFVNAGRGEHVVMADLLAALDSGQLRGALLDVFDTEPLSATDPLWTHPGLIITPHMASSASDRTIIRQVVGNTRKVCLNHMPEHVMDRDAGY